MTFYAGLDLGQSADYTALIIGEIPNVTLETETERQDRAVQTFLTAGTQFAPPTPASVDTSALPLLIRYAKRFPLKTAYPQIVRDVKALFSRPELKADSILGLDGTGVGQAVVDMFNEADMPCELIPIFITGGASVTEKTNALGGLLGYNVPKRDLAAAIQVRLQNRLLRIAAGVEDAKVLEQEMLNFKVKISVKGNDTYEAWREGDHDDLVLGAGIACWVADLRSGVGIRTI